MPITHRIYTGITHKLRHLHPDAYRPYILQAISFVSQRKYMPLSQYRKYITPYRALLLFMLLPIAIFLLLRLPYRQEVFMTFVLLGILTFVVEVLLFAFQFTRRECAYLEVLLLVLLIPFMVMM
ncbi:hypothetical protein CAP35_13155 [Chitinophagaceae bacterium IBVUCB1]|nr:hypothetical protein CAP35_13155 [Chitinophagaceae bacterium IBVUCB1]